MAGPPVTIWPWECRDWEDEAKQEYYHPLRRANQALTDENLKLKRILRENGISWSPLAQAHLNQNGPFKKRKTRSSLLVKQPQLPTEVLLRILRFAMQSPHPIIDPLSSRTPEHLTEKEKKQGNQIAIHFLATCKAMHAEGTRYLWDSNEFVFTTPQVLRRFSEVSAKYRHNIKHITLRVIARFYDDSRTKHKLNQGYHRDLKQEQPLKLSLRPKESPLIRGGFRCYTWNQVIDFLAALRAPYDPLFRDGKKNPPARLLPSLTSMRIDLVNFTDGLTPFSGSEFHEITSHELGCTLNELQVTGMPGFHSGVKATTEICGLLKDEGIFLDGLPAFFAPNKGFLQPLSGDKWCARVIRAYKGFRDVPGFGHDEHDTYNSGHPKLGTMPAAPSEKGHPKSTRPECRVIWKRVPITRDSTTRTWAQFSRVSGYEVEDLEYDSDDDTICPCCGDLHPASSFVYGSNGDSLESDSSDSNSSLSDSSLSDGSDDSGSD